MIVRMNEFGRSLTTRAMGRDVYRQINRLLSSSDETVAFDFLGVDSITNSFADEVFGRLALELGIDELQSRTSFKNISLFWARVVRQAIDARAAEQRLAVC